MKENEIRRYFVIALIFLLIGASVIPTNIGISTIQNNSQNFIQSEELINNGHSDPRILDGTGKTNFHGLFVGTSKGNEDRFGGEADKVSDSLSGPGWDNDNKTTLENESATKKKY